MSLLGACAQFTTSDDERAALQARTDQQAAAYLDCVKREALLYTESSSDAAFVYESVADRCAGDLESYKAIKTELLETDVMMTSKPLAVAVDDLERQARVVIADQMVAGRAPAGAAPAAVPAARASAAPSAVPPPPAGGWATDQRVYLDCMLEQAKRYSTLNESAETIAEVAQNNCRSYLTGSNAGALAQEGRAVVLNQVFESRVTPRR